MVFAPKHDLDCGVFLTFFAQENFHLFELKVFLFTFTQFVACSALEITMRTAKSPPSPSRNKANRDEFETELPIHQFPLADPALTKISLAFRSRRDTFFP